MSQRGEALRVEQGVDAYLLGVVFRCMVAGLAAEVVCSLCLGYFVDAVMVNEALAAGGVHDYGNLIRCESRTICGGEA